MSKNVIELLARFKDMASQGLRRLAQETERTAQQQTRAWSRAGRQHQQSMGAYARLGIRSEHQIRREIQQTQAAYNRLARSGTASQRELARAADATRNRIRQLNNEMGQGVAQSGRWQQVAGGIRNVAAGTLAAGAAGYMVLKPAMDNQKQLESNISHVAWQAFGEDDSKSAAWIANEGKQQVRDLVTSLVKDNGGNADAALNLVNSMMANGMSFGEVQGNARASYRAMIASGEGGQYNPEDTAKLMKVLSDYGLGGDKLALAFEHAMKSGMQGNFEISDMVRELPALLPAAKSAGLDGVEGLDFVLSLLQSAANKAGSNSEAANNVRNMLEKTLSPDTVKRLANMANPNDPGKGIDWEDSILRGRENGENAVQVMARLANTVLEKDAQYQQLKARAESGDQTAESQMNIMRGFVLSQILPDIQAKAGLLAATDTEQINAYMRGLAGLNGQNDLVGKKIEVLSQDHAFKQEQNRALAMLGQKGLLDPLNDAETKWTALTAEFPNATLGLQALTAAATAASVAIPLFGGGKGMLGKLFGGAAGGSAAGSGGGGAANAARGLMGKVAGGGAWGPWMMGAGMLLHSPKLNQGENEWLQQRRLDDLRSGRARMDNGVLRYQPTPQTPLDAPALQAAATQMSESGQLQKLASDAFGQSVQTTQQAAQDTQAASQQMQQAAAQMTAAAAQMHAAAARPVPVTVTVQNGNIAAYVQQVANRDNRRN